MYYVRTADRLQRTAPWQQEHEGGLDRIREIVVDDALGIAADLEAYMARHVDDYEDEWAAVLGDPERLRQFSSFVNAPDVADPTLAYVTERGQRRPATPAERAAGAHGIRPRPHRPDHPGGSLMTAVADRLTRVDICSLDQLTPELGVAALVGGEQVAVFRLADDRVFAVSNLCPFSGAAVIARGITGSRGDVPTIASPVYKQVFSLDRRPLPGCRGQGAGARSWTRLGGVRRER